MAIVMPACGDDGSAAGEGTSTGSSSGDVSATSTGDVPGSSSETEAATTEATAADDSSSSGGFEPPEPACGNGFVEADEECDDANDDDDDGCTSACELQCGLEWTALALPPTDQSRYDARGVAMDDDGGAVVAGFLREITTDQRGNETAELDEGVVVRVDGDGETQWGLRLAADGARVDVTGVALDADGNAYVSATLDPLEGNQDIRVYKLDPDGAEVWTFDYDSAVDSAEDVSFGIAMGADGNPVVTGQVRVGEGDDDIWVASVDAGTGEELWSSTWSGAATGAFSTDDGGPIAVAPDGTIYVLAGEYIDFQTNLVTLVAFEGTGGPAISTHTPEAEFGTMDFVPLDVSVQDDGAVLLNFVRLLPAEAQFLVTRFDPETNEEVWRTDALAFEAVSPVEDADGFTLQGAGPLPGGGVAITGTLVRSGDGTAWNETWVARFDDADELDCMFVRESPQLSLVPGSLQGREIATGAGDRAIVAAQAIEEGAESLWIGAFRAE